MPKPDSVNLILTFCEPDSDEINFRNLRTLMIEFSDSVVAKSKRACVLPPYNKLVDHLRRKINKKIMCVY